MPYYIYRIASLGIPECLGSAPGYRDAKRVLREKREHETDPHAIVRMIFADNELAAVDLLTTPREAPPPEGDDE